MYTYSVIDIKNELSKIMPSFDVAEVILFGSYAKGVATEHSDMDFYVKTGDSVRGLSFFVISNEIAEAFNCRVDVIGHTDIIGGSPIDEEIKNTGVLVYVKG
ncbi:MAG: nucleotidyltransferase domain-containing protein [Defluviitaleaceae bacterium]|nr:nucleotidyltransferase domain-containing protein [Defluviitaleaceae bacterium]